jgi:cation diffusion facilitator family transporter
LPPSTFHPKKVTWLGLILNILLMSLKMIVGIMSGSHALMADGIHTATDLSTDLAVLWSIRVSGHPADADHPYGHRRFQSLASLLISVILGIGAAGIVYDSLKSLTGEAEKITSWIPFIVAVVSIVLKEFLFQVTKHTARLYRDKALLANAWHHRSDAFSSVAVAVGIGFVLLGGPRWHFMDHLIAVILAFIIFTVVWRIGREAVHELTDRAPSPELVRKIQALLSAHPNVRDFHAIRARTLGGFVEMDFHILVDPELSVKEGHDIAEEVKRSIMEADDTIMNVVVHVEPIGD